MKNKYGHSRLLAIDEALRTKTRKAPNLKELQALVFSRTLKFPSILSIQKDLWDMRYSTELGYRAPIAYDSYRKGYVYTDPDFTINVHELMSRIKKLKNKVQ